MSSLENSISQRISLAYLSQVYDTLAVSQQRARRNRVGAVRRLADFHSLLGTPSDVPMENWSAISVLFLHPEHQR